MKSALNLAMFVENGPVCGTDPVCDSYIYEPPHGKTNLGFRTGPIQIRLYCYRIKLEA